MTWHCWMKVCHLSQSGVCAPGGCPRPRLRKTSSMISFSSLPQASTCIRGSVCIDGKGARERHKRVRQGGPSNVRGERTATDIFCSYKDAMPCFGSMLRMLYADLIGFRMFSESFHTLPGWAPPLHAALRDNFFHLPRTKDRL